MLLASAAAAEGSEASQLYRQARKAEKRGQFAQAYLLYSRAASADPGQRKYAIRAEAVRRSAAEQSPPQVASGPALPEAASEDPGDFFDSLTEREYAAARQPRSPVALEATPGLQTIEFEGTDHQ